MRALDLLKYRYSPPAQVVAPTTNMAIMCKNTCILESTPPPEPALEADVPPRLPRPARFRSQEEARPPAVMPFDFVGSICLLLHHC